MALKPASLDHVNVYVRNVDRSCAWYRQILGLEVTDFIDRPELRIAFLAADPEQAHEIALMEIGEDAAGPQERQVGLNHFAWKMASLDDLKAMYLHLRERGIRIDHCSDHGVAYGVYFHDPDGNGVEVYYELPREQWGQARPFSERGNRGRFPGPWDEAKA